MLRHEAVLDETGPRAHRRRPLGDHAVCASASTRAVSRHAGRGARVRAGVLRLPRPLEVHAFYDQLCPACATTNFAARTELADLRGRVALLTGGHVNRLPGRAEAVALGGAADLAPPGSRAMPRCATRRSPTWRLERAARDRRGLESATRLERRGLLSTPGRQPWATRLPPQQRLSDGAAAAGVLRAHDGRRAVPARELPAHVRQLSVNRRGRA